MTSWCGNVPAPVDSNGCVVPLDTRELVYRGETREVYGFSFSHSARRGRWDWCAVFENSDAIRLNACTMPDSWEKLERDARKAPREYIEGRGIAAGKDGRVAAMTSDLVRRAKALAGVTENDRDSSGPGEAL